MTQRKINVESLLQFGKKVSFPAILAIPLIGGALAVSWSAAESAQAEVGRPAEGEVAPASAADSGPALVPRDVGPDAAPEAEPDAAELEGKADSGDAAAPTDSAAVPQLHRLQEAALPPAAAEPATLVRELTVAPGDTLMALLIGLGAEPAQAHQAVTAMAPVFSPRRLRPGQEITVAFADSGSETPGPLLAINFRPSRERDIEISRDSASDEFFAESIDRPVARQLAYAEGTIDSSLSAAATDRNVPHSVLAEAIGAFSYDVDFQREIQEGDSFEFFYEIFVDEEGALVRTGDLLFAAMTLSGTTIEFYYYERADGSGDFYTPGGASVRRSLMRTPIDGARLSSHFGMRRHPILGYSRMHKGTDFAAPRGTPIYAAGSGVVDYAGRNGGYGNYVRLRHGSTYQTAYAHMKGFAKGIAKGKRVKQGQVIGYVGTTGRSTGPHLHYEVHVNGKQVNPLKVTLPRGEKLKATEMADFAAHRHEVERQLALAQGGMRLVQRACAAESGELEQGSTLGSDNDC